MDISTNLIAVIAIFAAILIVFWFFSRRAMGGDADRIESVREVAQRGDVYSQFRLGQLFYEGKGVGRDDAEAARWFLAAAQQDHAEAQYILASMLEKGAGVKRSDEEAFRWYLQAATQGHERASVILEADKWNPYKQKHLSGGEVQAPVFEPEGKGISADQHTPDRTSVGDEQIRKYLAKAQDGDVDAQYNLGIIYYHGEGVARNHDEALKWFQLAAQQGDADAQVNLGYMYGRGEGTAKDHRASMVWFQKAADQGHEGARDILEKMFRKA